MMKLKSLPQWKISHTKNMVKIYKKKWYEKKFIEIMSFKCVIIQHLFSQSKNKLCLKTQKHLAVSP